MLLESFRPFPVIKGVVCVEPIALRVHFQVRNLGNLMVLDEKLPLRDQRRDEVNFRVVQMKLVLVQRAIHVGIGEENLRRAGFDDDIQNVGLSQLIERLRGQDHRCVLLSPSLEGFDDIALDAGIAEERPRLIDKKCFENVRYLAVGDRVVSSMENVKEQRLQNLRVLFHSLKVEALEARKTHRVFGVVEKEPELSACRPLVEFQGEGARECVGQHSQSSQFRVNAVEIFDLLVNFLLFFERKLFAAMVIGKNLHEEGEKVEIGLRFREAKGVDFERGAVWADFDVAAFKQWGEALEAPAQVEDECVRIVFLQIGDEEIQEERFPRPRPPEDHGMGGVFAMQIQVVRRSMVRFEHGEVFLVQMAVDLVPGMQRKEQGVIGVVCVEDEHGPQIEGMIAGHGSEIGVKEVVFLFVKLGVMNVERFIKVRAGRFDL